MTKEKALAVLNLFPPASREEIEKAYQRLVRRYPPEFHPEKFRALDEAYRFLTSLAFRIERSLSPQAKVEIDKESFSFDLTPPTASLEGALNEIKTKLKDCLPLETPRKRNRETIPPLFTNFSYSLGVRELAPALIVPQTQTKITFEMRGVFW